MKLTAYLSDQHMNSIESIWAEVILKSQRIITACIYRPPNQRDFLKHLTPILERFSGRSNIVLLGDLNIDMSKEDAYLSATLHRTLAKLALQNVIKDYTRITDKSKTLIDLAITSVNNAKITNSGSYDSAISDHNLIYVTVNYFVDRPPSKIKTVKDYKNLDHVKLKSDLDTAPWQVISIFDDVDDSLWAWEELFNNTINDHVKSRKVKIRPKSEPWMKGVLRKELNNRYRLFQKAKLTQKGSNEWKQYKKSRNRCSNMIKTAKANFWRTEFGNSKNSKTFWKTVQKFGGGECKGSTIGPLVDKETIITDDNQKSELMNNFFATVGKELAIDLQDPDHTFDCNKHINRVTPTTSDIKTDYVSFEKSFIKAVKPGKACGLDKISARDLKINEPASINGLYHVMVSSVKSGKFPTKWKSASVSCIFKKGSKRNCSNYRPVSLLSIPSKIVEHFICTQMNDHLTTYNLLSEHQWGFRKARSTEDLLLYLTESWHAALDKKKVVAILLIDFKKAFDSVSHEILLKKLSACGFAGDFHEYIADYLTGRSQVTKVNGVVSSKASVDYGVPQGSLLGPTCFSVNVNDMPEAGTAGNELFADDSTSFTVGDSVDSVLNDIQKHADSVAKYSSENSLTIHPQKCQIIILNKQKFVGPLPRVKIKDTAIEVTEKSKCLGVIIDNKLSWGPHTTHVCAAFSNKIKKLYKMNSLDKVTLRTIYNTGILPSVLYGILIWGNAADHLINDIERIHIKAARFVERISKSIPDSEVLNVANWKPINFYYKKHLACKTYKIYNGLSPLLLQKFISKSTTRTTRNKLKINQPLFQSVAFKRSFAYRAAIVWNNITTSIREKSSVDCFKLALSRSNDIGKINFGQNSTARARDPENYLYY